MKKLLFLAIVVATLLSVSCKQTPGEKAEVNEAAIVENTSGIEIPVDVNNSVVGWEGSKPTGTHTGTINLNNGNIIVNKGKVTGGSFVIDMNSISSTDLEGDWKNNLDNHLKGFAEGKEDHFFNVAKYPTAKFEITKIAMLTGDEDANNTVYGNLTIRDITKEVGFRANISVNGDRVEVSTPQFTLDRTQWGVNYGSKSIFDDLGDKFVNDEIGLKIDLQAGKAAM